MLAFGACIAFGHLAAQISSPAAPVAAAQPARDYPVQPVPFTSVRITGGFWKTKQDINREVTIPFAFQQCEESGRLKNFDLAAEVMRRRAAGEKNFQINPPTQNPFDDTDVYKSIEAASYVLSMGPNPALEKKVDEWIQTCRSGPGAGWLPLHLPHHAPGYRRPQMGGNKGDFWENDPKLSHELYDAGHLYEAGVAYYQATGKRTLLDVCLRRGGAATLAHLWRCGGAGGFAPGHQIVEMGLVKLYPSQGDQRWLQLAKTFLDNRGPGGSEYNQMHKLVTDQDTAVGHAVRANYMYSGMADVAALTGDPRYFTAINKIWDNVSFQKTLYHRRGRRAPQWRSLRGRLPDYRPMLTTKPALPLRLCSGITRRRPS
ncbi:MAG: glycoside hydrolase family 127 protein [Chthoniobacteraceae bacterium]